MIMKVVPIKVKVGATLDNRPKFPDWQMLPLAEKKSPVEEMFFEWMFDKTGYKENTSDSPYGMQWAIRLVSERFAKQAAEAFPHEIFVLTEEELRKFWNEKITAHLPDQIHDADELVALNARLSLMKLMEEDETEVRERIEKALDPDDLSLGVRKHPFKNWDDFKRKNSIQIISVRR